MDSEIRTIGNIDQVSADILENFDYAALGHIHKPMKVGGEVYRYCGTPLACSVSEAGQKKEIIMVDIKEKTECARKLQVDIQVSIDSIYIRSGFKRQPGKCSCQSL